LDLPESNVCKARITPCAGQGLTDAAHQRARATDPETSHAAAARAGLFAKGHASRILAALHELGSATAHEIAAATGLTVVQIDRRLPELERAGKARVLTMAAHPLVRDGYRVWTRSAV
jgi:hypothetical protein